MNKERPLLDKEYLLEKFPGKGGWTYAAIPEILQDKHAHFGWVKVKGSIDGFEIRNYNLMPMGNGQLFLPVRAEIRKKIGKKAGDWVNVILFSDNGPAEIPEEFMVCLLEDPDAHKTFTSLSNGQQKKLIDWIYSAKTDDKKVERMAETMNRLVTGFFFGDK
ncbi:MAG: YdeI/OmpD-associated family protein [Prolixibacteraceae bacterium]|jgi:hypothetical protein|nr:YdeI/OmpD-associated family protein [Prolixibacteraceae bacterium]